MAEIKLNRGRPTTYTCELATEICNTIASTSIGTKKLCAENSHWPAQDTLFTWLKTHPEFSEQYKRAKICQVDLLVDELLDIADDASHDLVIDETGKKTYDSERVARSKLRVETRKWLASRLVPRVYGNKPDPDNDFESNMTLAEDLRELRTKLAQKYIREY
jgi:hypothetical protein